MKDLKTWEEKIKEKRKKTDFRDFVKEICSWSILNLYKNKGKLSRYPETKRRKNLDNIEFQSASNYFIDYDFKKGFFKNFEDLFGIVPLQYLIDFGNNENADFCEQVFGVKNGYLSFVVGLGIENIVYSAFCYSNLSNIFNGYFITNNCSNIYFSSGIDNSYNIFYSKYIFNCSNIYFSTNLTGSSECIFCNGLQSKKYCFQNKEYSKEDYLALKKQILNSKDKFLDNYKYISKNKAENYLSENIFGDYIIKSTNIENGFFINKLESSRNVINSGLESNNFFDCFDVGTNSMNFYGCINCGDSSENLYCSTQIVRSTNIYYSYFMINCSFCIGCIGLKNKSYCILNKQYSKEDWYFLANKIFTGMDMDGIIGDFFPGSINPFYFNDTMAYLIDDSFSKEEVEKEGFMWREEKINVDIPNGVEIIFSSKFAKENYFANLNGLKQFNECLYSEKILNDFQGIDEFGNWIIDKEILRKVIIDENGNYYKIVEMEYNFLMKFSLPLPEIHWLDRIKLGYKFN